MARRARTWALVIAALAAAVVVVLRCGAARPAPAAVVERSPGPAAEAPQNAAGATPTPAPPAQALAATPADTGAATEASAEHGPSDVARMLHATDAHDRTLLADIERRTSASPPDSVYELIALRQRGAPREELARFIEQHLAQQLLIRVAAQRWLRAAMPRPGLEGEREPARIGGGGGPKLVKPIERVER